MGVEKEKLESSIIMDEDEFCRSVEPILSRKGKAADTVPDRDPHDINAHLKVTAGGGTLNWHSESVTCRGCRQPA